MSYDSNSISIKLVILGDSFVGKTSLVHKFMGNDFSKRYQKTFGSDISFKQMHITDINNKHHKFAYSIWDIYGEATFEELKSQFLWGTKAILFIYDVSNRNSFKNITNWFEIANKTVNLKNCQMVLCGNKIDLRSNLQDCIPSEEGLNLFKSLANKYNLKNESFQYLETSALEGTNIQLTFETIGKMIIQFMELIQDSSQ